jgi:uncharacterized membrane protein
MKAKPNGSLRALRTTALGGVFFLLPIVVVGILLTYIYRIVATIHEHVKPWIPFHSATGIAMLFCLAIVLLLAACFVAGLVARHAIGRHFSRSIEQQLITVFPKYGIYKDLLAGKIGRGENVPSLCPVLVKKDGVFSLAFQADRLANGVVVAYFPGAPDAWSGSIALVAPENVHHLEVSFAEALGLCERLGRDSSSLFTGANIETSN